MYILGIHNGHDASACLFRDQDMFAFCKEERLTRKKNDGRRFNLSAIDEVLSIAGITKKDVDVVSFSKMYFPANCYIKQKSKLQVAYHHLIGHRTDRNLMQVMNKEKNYDELQHLHIDAIKNALGVSPETEIHFVNHHLSHVLGALKYTCWNQDALYISCDGGGDNACYSTYHYDGKRLDCLYGGAYETMNSPHNLGASIGLAYAFITGKLGFTPNRHEGKITGLAAFGTPIKGEEIRKLFQVTEQGGIESHLQDLDELHENLSAIIDGVKKEDVAASIQYATEKVIKDWVQTLLTLYPVKFIGMSGGVFANVRLNQIIAELPGVKEVFIFPAMGDEGLSAGNCIWSLIQKNGMNNLERKQLDNVYFGYHYSSQTLLETSKLQNLNIVQDENIAQKTAKLLAKGLAGAIYSHTMEMGPRALGGRSILASPVKREINDSLNDRLGRTEFMPFAPYVRVDDCQEVFEIDEHNREACRFMTITTNVKQQYHSLIQAVIHVDGTARPQIISRDTNPLYYDILTEFKQLTDIPCLVNTSFNAHEEPIINTPQEAVQSLVDDRVDFLVCDSGIIFVRHEIQKMLDS